jgi:hypothetical protein
MLRGGFVHSSTATKPCLLHQFTCRFLCCCCVMDSSCRSQISKYESDRQMVMQAEHLQDNTALQQVSSTSAQRQQIREQQA